MSEARSAKSAIEGFVGRVPRMSVRAWWIAAAIAWVVCLGVVEAMAISVNAQPQDDRVTWVAVLAVMPIVPLLGTSAATGVRALVGGRGVWRDAGAPRMLVWTSLVLAMIILPLPTN